MTAKNPWDEKRVIVLGIMFLLVIFLAINAINPPAGEYRLNQIDAEIDVGVDDDGGSGSRPTHGGSVSCGNGVVGEGEDCEGDNLQGKDCYDFGFKHEHFQYFDAGELSCDNSCKFNTSGCYAACEGGMIEDWEECDESIGNNCLGESECILCQCIGKHEPVDTDCVDNSDGQVYQIIGNEVFWTCSHFNVKSTESGVGGINFLDYIVDDALDCCLPKDSVSKYHQEYCDVAKSLTSDTKDCLTYFFHEGFTDTQQGFTDYWDSTARPPWANGYFYPENCCSEEGPCEPYGIPGECKYKISPPGRVTFNEYVQGLECTVENNDCHLRDQPAIITAGKLNTGTCVDYSILVTTLFRKTNFFHGFEVLSVKSSLGHWYNLVYMNEHEKWVVLNFGTLVFQPEQEDNLISEYCDNVVWCGQETLVGNCNQNWVNANVYGCTADY